MNHALDAGRGGRHDGIATWLDWGGEEKCIGMFEPRAELNAGDVIYDQVPGLVERMDLLDQAGITAAGDNPRHMLEQLLVLSTNKLSIVTGGRAVLMMGTLVAIRDRVAAEAWQKTPAAQFWLVSAHDVDRVPRVARKLVRHAVREYCKHYESLYGYVHTPHHRALRLLEWLGARLEASLPFGPLKEPFRKFTLRG